MRNEVIEVPVRARRLTEVMSQTPAQSPGPQGAAHVEVVAWSQAERSEASDPQPAPAAGPQQQDIGTGPRVYSIGHSTRPLAEFLRLLEKHGVQQVVDIRHSPSSRHNPQYNRPELEAALRAAGIEYLWLGKLGGYREEGYASYRQTAAFREGVDELEALAQQQPAAFLCAELKWWRCHRRHVSDALAARGWRVIHILNERRVDEHCPKTNRIPCDGGWKK